MTVTVLYTNGSRPTDTIHNVIGVDVFKQFTYVKVSGEVHPRCFNSNQVQLVITQ